MDKKTYIEGQEQICREKHRVFNRSVEKSNSVAVMDCLPLAFFWGLVIEHESTDKNRKIEYGVPQGINVQSHEDIILGSVSHNNWYFGVKDVKFLIGNQPENLAMSLILNQKMVQPREKQTIGSRHEKKRARKSFIYAEQTFKNEEGAISGLYWVCSLLKEQVPVPFMGRRVEQHYESNSTKLLFCKLPTKTEKTRLSHFVRPALTNVKMVRIKQQTNQNYFAMKVKIYNAILNTGHDDLLQETSNVA